MKGKKVVKKTRKKASKKKTTKRRDFFKKDIANKNKRKRKEEALLKKLEKIKMENAKKLGLLKDMEKEDHVRKVVRKKKLMESKRRIPGEELFEIKTDFDRVFEKVNARGQVSATQLMKEVGMEKEQFTECYSILSEKKLIKLNYPVVGKLHLTSMTYDEEQKQKKKDKKELKKGEKE
jgi:hypothetical protein